ncbi:ABC transporter permease subunit [Streptococcus catagoni]|uniref:ABC transporter permease subunit n=1 Tax=Streptococcus catagoni TaxID=2654874 RepID=UPI00140B7F5C|nr:ABC transporter permease subunit [Streptococcus catagoni]
MTYLKLILEKEWIENLRRHKTLAMLICGIIFGILGPFTALIMPQIMAGLLPKGLSQSLPQPSYIDSYIQYFKNINQLGFIILVFLFSNSLTQELAQGTLINLLTKGLPRSTVILAKFSIIAGIWTLSYSLGSAVHYAYTLYYFNNQGSNKLTVYLGTWLFGLLLLSLIFLFSTLLKKNSGVLLGMLATIVLFFLLSFLKAFREWNPLLIIQKQAAVLQGDYSPQRYQILLVITLVLIIFNLSLSIIRFARIEL